MISVKKAMSKFCAVALSALVAVGGMTGVQLAAGDADAHALGGGVTINPESDLSAFQGDNAANISYEIYNGRGESVVVKNMTLTIDGKGVSVSQNNGSVTVPSGGSQSVSFKVSVSKQAEVGNHNCYFYGNLTTLSGEPLPNQYSLENRSSFHVIDTYNSPTKSGDEVYAVDVSHGISPGSGFTMDGNNKLRLEFRNVGNATLRGVVAELTLPEGLAIYNGSNQVELGYLSTGNSKKADFTIAVESGTESKNYPIGVEVKRSTDDKVLAKKTIYVPVEGEGGSTTANNLAITGVNCPEEVTSGTPFSLSFNVKNNGSSNIRNVKTTVEPDEGLLNKSRNIFIDSLGPGESKNYTVKLYAFEGSDDKSYAVKITATPTWGNKENTGVTQYATVTVSSAGGKTKHPQIMVTNYSYGGNAVQAGAPFYLNLGLFNTSGKTLSNVKVTLDDKDGNFMPEGGSNSFYIEKMGPKGHYTKSIRFTTKPGAEQKTVAMTVAMTYEDGTGESFESSDTISIPITQKTRLVVDDLVPPQEIYVGMPSNCEVQFYNMGKATLENVRVSCEGNFDVSESNSYYAGNMESGKSDSYRFNFIPREVGTMEGTITFTFEDSNGESDFLEIPFAFEVQEEPVYEDEFDDEEPEEKKVPWSLIIAGAAVVLGVVAGIIIRKRRKKKLHDALSIDDDLDFDMEDTEIAEEKSQKKDEKKK